MKRFQIMVLIGAIIASAGTLPYAWNTIAETAGQSGFIFSGKAIEVGKLVMLPGAALLFYGFVRWALIQFEELHHYTKKQDWKPGGT